MQFKSSKKFYENNFNQCTILQMVLFQVFELEKKLKFFKFLFNSDSVRSYNREFHYSSSNTFYINNFDEKRVFQYISYYILCCRNNVFFIQRPLNASLVNFIFTQNNYSTELNAIQMVNVTIFDDLSKTEFLLYY